jgi:molybdopterin/thiamine biosynthesis adenylyltransferase
MNDRYLRHADIVDVDKLKMTPISIIGAGSVGSFTCLSLVKMGAHRIEIWDDDLVSEVNIPNQFYRVKDIEEYKVDALKSMIMDFEEIPITVYAKKHTGKEPLGEVVITALDNMLARKRIWDIAKKDKKVKLFIDPRMAKETSRIYALDPETGAEEYEKTLYSDDEAVQERCSEKTVIYGVLGISSLICKLLKDHLALPITGCREVILDFATYMLIYNKNK